MKILVYGGAGFIGGNLCNRFSESGHDVEYVDIRYYNAGPQNTPEQAKEIDIGGMGTREYDIAYWVAGRSSAPMFSDYVDVSADVTDFSVFLQFINTKRLVVASTSSFYENPPSLENEIIRPKTYYEAAKRCHEEIACCYARQTGTPTVVSRFFSVYGPGEEHKGKYANLITQMIWAGIKKQKFEIYGDGEQTRDFTHVYDIVAALKILGQHPAAVDDFEVYNIGTGQSCSLNNIAEYIATKIPGFKWKYVPNKISHYVTDTQAESTKIRNLGWRHNYGVFAGISETILRNQGVVE